MREQLNAGSDTEALLKGRTRKRLRYVYGATYFIAITTLLFPYFYAVQITLCALFPLFLLAIIKNSKGQITIGHNLGDTLSMLPAFFICLGVLIIRALNDTTVMDYTLFWIPASLVTLVITTFIRYSDTSLKLPTNKPSSYFAIALFTLIGAAYAFGLVASINIAYDTVAPTVYKTQVLEKRKYIGSSGSRIDFDAYYLKLSSWGPKSDIDEVSVRERQYNRVNPKDSVTVKWYEGALGIPNYKISVK